MEDDLIVPPRPVKEMFDVMAEDIETADELVNNSYKVYEDTSVRVDEIDRTVTDIVEEGGVSRSTRVTLENYVPDDDQVLPSQVMYTAEPSMVNYDTTLTWACNRKDELLVNENVLGARFAALGLNWIKKYGLEVSDELSLKSVFDKIEDNTEKASELFDSATVNLSVAVSPLIAFITSLGLDPNNFDTEMHDNWSRAARKRLMLEQLITPVVGVTLNGMTIGLAHDHALKLDFKQYCDDVEFTFKAITTALNKCSTGEVSFVDLSMLAGGINTLRANTVRFTILLSQVGVGYDLDMKVVDDVLKSGEDSVELLDDDHVEIIDKVVDNFVRGFNLNDDTPDQIITILEPSTMSDAMDENNTVLSVLLDALRVIVATHNSLMETANAKNNLVNAYVMFLSSMVE